MSVTTETKRTGRRADRVLIMLVCGLGGVLVAGLILARVLLFQPFNVPSGAMAPTLLIGDYFVASKTAYGYGRYSLPFLPDFSGRIFAAQPARGAVVVFRLPKDPSVTFVKRVVGLPGDRIQMIGGVLNINDRPVRREQIADFFGRDFCGSGERARTKRWRETLPEGVSYETLDCAGNAFLDNTQVYTVPAGHYFMMGDNRQNSSDSRVTQVGYVPFENLIGRVERIFLSGGSLSWRSL